MPSIKSTIINIMNIFNIEDQKPNNTSVTVIWDRPKKHPTLFYLTHLYICLHITRLRDKKACYINTLISESVYRFAQQITNSKI